MSGQTDHKGKVALVTGANKGIGFEVSRQLAGRGMTVLMGARNLHLGEEAVGKLRAAGLAVKALELDVTRPETIATAASAIEKEYGRLDVLVNNAGIADRTDGPPGKVDIDVVRRTLEVNFYGPLQVTQAMLPLLRKAEAARIVNVSSGLGSLTLNADPAWPFAEYKFMGYNGSKALLNMMTVQLAYELRDTRIKVNAVNPGYTATDMNANSGTQTVAEGSEEIVRQATSGEDGVTGGFSSREGVDPW
jgi:NAD(P)-dependent dehydrogenase (short-subunit alcohol dehydrogenase family)